MTSRFSESEPIRETTGFSPADIQFMRRALELARQGQGFVEPNPMVGCVITRDQQPLSEGYHRQFGGAHAEVEAINALQSAAAANGATAYVTLEPCSHTGKTPPCTDALIASKVARVVIAMQDPFPKVAGSGIQRLRQAGIQVDVGLLENESRQLNLPYLKRVQSGIPWVIAKWAMTADGRIATRTGESQWITGELARQEVHRLRSRVDAILVGMGTVRDDDPMLTVRLPDGVPVPRIATRVVFCKTSLPNKDSNLVKTAAQHPTLLLVSSALDQNQTDPLRRLGLEIANLSTADPIQMVCKGMELLGNKGMTNVMVEGGSSLLGSLEQEIDECHVYVGPKRFGGKNAPGPIGGQGIASIDDAKKMTLVSVDQFKDDVRMIYQRS